MLSAIALYSSGSRDAVDAKAALRVVVAERAPEARRLDEQLDPDLALERRVAGGVLIPHHGIGNVRADVERRCPRRPVAGALVSADRAPGEGCTGKAQLARPLAGKVERRVTPAKSVSSCSRRCVRQHGQDEVLGIPERVAVVAGAGETLRADRALLGPRTGLKRVEERKANSLLQLGVTVELDVRTPPEVVQVGTLRRDQPLPAGMPRFGESRDGEISDGGEGTLARRAVREELDDAQPLAGSEVSRNRHPAHVGGALGGDLQVVRALDEVIHGGGEPKPARPGRVDEDDTVVVRRVLLGLER